MNEEEIRNKILSLFREKEIMKNLTEDEDFFELGVSSLTIVELQIVIEQALKIKVPTGTLMSSSTVREWVDIYVEGARKLSTKDSSVSAL